MIDSMIDSTGQPCLLPRFGCDAPAPAMDISLALSARVGTHYTIAPQLKTAPASGFEMCFAVGSQHQRCSGQNNTSSIQHKEVQALFKP